MKWQYLAAIGGFLLATIIVAVTIISATEQPPAQVEAMMAPAQDTERYLNYTEQRFQQLTHQRRVLFFKADWCTSCADANEDLQGRSAELPADVTVLRVNYDLEKALRQQYGVTVQHTFVMVDEQGNLQDIWVGGGMKELLEKVT